MHRIPQGGPVNTLQEARPVEVRLDEESRRLASVSVSTLLYMMDYGLARERDLARHRVYLGYVADDEHDLFEAMRLSARLNRVDGNIRRTGRANEGIRAELVRRGLRR
jgi:hypothetical protein